MMINRRRVMGGGKSLPYDYEVEYLQGDGASLIDTGVNMQQLIVAQYTFQLTTISGIFMIFGVYTDNNNSARAQIYINNGTWKDYNLNNLTTTGTNFSANANINTVYNLTSSTRNILASDLTLYIFGRNPINGTAWAGYNKMKLFKLTMTSNGVLVRDFIPVVKDNIGYMYDKVSGELFGNAGSGSFVVGPRVS